MLRTLAVLMTLSACRSGGDVRLTGDSAAALRKIIGHDAITLSEKLTIYGVEAPAGSTIACHEDAHKRQARVIGDALVAIGAIEDEDVTRAAAWLAVYGIDYGVYGYANRFEKGAIALCR